MTPRKRKVKRVNKIAELEKRIEQLEKRPPIVINPVPTLPSYPAYPDTHPWPKPYYWEPIHDPFKITCGSK